MASVTDNKIVYSFIGKKDIQRQLKNADDFANLNASQIDTLLGLVASCIKKVAPIGIIYSVAKAAAEVEVVLLKSVLAECAQYNDFEIIVISTYRFTGWGTGTSNPGYPTYELDSVDYNFEAN